MLCQPEERKTILQLAHPSCGLKMGSLGDALRMYLEPLVTTKTSCSGELSWLSAPQLRQTLQVMHPVSFDAMPKRKMRVADAVLQQR